MYDLAVTTGIELARDVTAGLNSYYVIDHLKKIDSREVKGCLFSGTLRAACNIKEWPAD